MKLKLKKGPWTREEDQKLLAYIEKHGHGSWRVLPAEAGLQRCGKSCRLRWANYLRPDIKRGKLSSQEEKTIIRLHALLGNRWSAIATHLPKRTDNEIKNYWNTRLKKRLTRMGIDPATHKPKNNPGGSLQSKDAANLSHMAQWETARLEAEARLVRESKFMSKLQHLHKTTALPPPRSELPCLDIFKVWQSTASWAAATKPMKHITTTAPNSFLGSATGSLESPTSTLKFPRDSFTVPTVLGFNNSSFMENVVDIEKSSACGGVGSSKLNYYYTQEVDGNLENPIQLQDNNNIEYPLDYDYNTPGLTDLLSLNYNSDGCSMTSPVVGDFEDDKYYWNDLLNLVSSPMESPIF